MEDPIDDLHREIRDKKLIKINNRENFKVCLVIIIGFYMLFGVRQILE